MQLSTGVVPTHEHQPIIACDLAHTGVLAYYQIGCQASRLSRHVLVAILRQTLQAKRSQASLPRKTAERRKAETGGSECGVAACELLSSRYLLPSPHVIDWRGDQSGES